MGRRGRRRRGRGPTSYIDAVTTPRQPGSALKPFVYALALDSGWTAAQVIDDAPLSESTSGGLHSYQNYSRRFYGPVALRDALGNSLNIPALKTLQYVGTEPYLRTLGVARLRAASRVIPISTATASRSAAAPSRCSSSCRLMRRSRTAASTAPCTTRVRRHRRRGARAARVLGGSRVARREHTCRTRMPARSSSAATACSRFPCRRPSRPARRATFATRGPSASTIATRSARGWAISTKRRPTA